MKPEKDFILLTLVHNEAGVIEGVIREFHREILSRLSRAELLVVEDGSSDGTREILQELRQELPFTLLTESGKQGYTTALRKALEYARGRGEFVFFSDSDGQQRLGDFWALKDRLDATDMVIGVRDHRQDSWFRNSISHWMNRIIIPRLFGIRLNDINCGFRVLRDELVRYMLEQEWFFTDCIFTELTIRAAHAGYRIAEAPVTHYQRLFGNSSGLPTKKMALILSRMLYNLLKLRFQLLRRQG